MTGKQVVLSDFTYASDNFDVHRRRHKSCFIRKIQKNSNTND